MLSPRIRLALSLAERAERLPPTSVLRRVALAFVAALVAGRG